jgi:hypothetical protein
VNCRGKNPSGEPGPAESPLADSPRSGIRETHYLPDDIAIKDGCPDAAAQVNFGETKEFPQSEKNSISNC